MSHTKICDCAMCASVRANKAPYTVASGKFRITATLARLGAIQGQVKAIKTPTVKAFRAALARKADKRQFPSFAEGASTASYVASYAKANVMLGLTPDADFFQPLGTTPQCTLFIDGVEEAL